MLRFVTIILLLACGVLAGLHAAGSALYTLDPETALRLNPGDPAAMTVAGEVALDDGPGTPASWSGIARRARAILRRDPLNAAAVRQLALAEMAVGRREQGEALAALAGSVSRRDGDAQFLLIEAAARREDHATALAHYDLLLATHEEMGEQLYPTLTAGLANPDIRGAFLTYLRSGVPWVEDFLLHAIATTDRPDILAALIVQSGGMPAGKRQSVLQAALIGRLIKDGAFPLAQDFLRTLPDAGMDMTVMAGFRADARDPAFGPLAWEVSTRPEIVATFGEGNRLEVSAEPDIAGPAARRTLLLPPGAYQLSAAVERLPASIPLAATLEVTCVGKGAAADRWSVSLPRPDDRHSLALALDIPSGCPAQQVALLILSDEGQQNAGLVLEDLTIRPVVRR